MEKSNANQKQKLTPILALAPTGCVILGTSARAWPCRATTISIEDISHWVQHSTASTLKPLGFLDQIQTLGRMDLCVLEPTDARKAFVPVYLSSPPLIKWEWSFLPSLQMDSVSLKTEYIMVVISCTINWTLFRRSCTPRLHRCVSGWRVSVYHQFLSYIHVSNSLPKQCLAIEH